MRGAGNGSSLVPRREREEAVQPAADGMESRILVALGTEIHYLVGGEGPPLLLVHGIGESNNCWTTNYSALTRHFRVYAPDLAGWGLTAPSPRIPPTVDGLSDFLVGFMDALGLERTNIVGWSLGGAATVAVAARAPERFPRVMLVAPAGMGSEVHWLFRLAELPLVGEFLFMPTVLTVRVVYQWLFSARMNAVPREFMQRALAKAKTPWHRKTSLDFIRGHRALRRGQRELDMRPSLGRLSMPVRVLWGRKDRVLPVHHGERVVRALPQASLAVFDECGHLPMVESSERFNNEVIGFFTAKATH